MGLMNTISTSRPALPGAGPLVESAIEVAGQLGLAGHLSGGPELAADLARATGTHGPSLHRLLRVLACVRLVDEVEPGMFALTRERGEGQDGEFGDGPSGAVSAAFPIFTADGLLHAVRTGQPAVRQLTARP